MVNFNELPHAAKGDADKLKGALQNALKAGLSVSEIREALSHQSAYIGFPMGLNGLILFNGLIKEREAAGIKDVAGKDASPVAADSDFYALGEQTQNTSSGAIIRVRYFLTHPRSITD